MLLLRLLGYVSLFLLFFLSLLSSPISSSFSNLCPSLFALFPFPISGHYPLLLPEVHSTRDQHRSSLYTPIPIPLVPLAGHPPSRSFHSRPIHPASARLIPDWLKWDSWVREQHNRLISIWENSTQEWAYDQGISPRLSIAKGKIVPEGAKEEHQRQKALGWDVSGNLDKE